MYIKIRGTSENNLQHIDVDFTDGLTVVTGVSGSGKSSLVFDTLYHEIRRRFSEAFSSDAHGARVAPANVVSITGAGPAIAVGQNLLNRNPASTMATAAGLHPFFRLLFSRCGERYCRVCSRSLKVFSREEITAIFASIAHTKPLDVYAPLVNGVKGSHASLLDYLSAALDSIILIDGSPFHCHGKFARAPVLDGTKPHTIWIYIGVYTRDNSFGLQEMLQEAASLGVNTVAARLEGEDLLLPWVPVCPWCNTWFHPLSPVDFNRSCRVCSDRGCPECAMTGLPSEASRVRWAGLNFKELQTLTVDEVICLLTENRLPPYATRLETEINERLNTLADVGLGYIRLDRPAPSLSRGEAQRLRLAVALTGNLEDMIHILDEPTIGQHPADVERLVNTFRRLNGPVIYVEHDRIAAALADHAVDIGPAAGKDGGRLVFSGVPEELWQAPTPTGIHFSSLPSTCSPEMKNSPEQFITIEGAAARNLKNIDLKIPLDRLTVITGVSGSGKSTLLEEVLVPSLLQGKPVFCRSLTGERRKPVFVNQDPIGINPRSNPATYTKLADHIRDYFSLSTGLSPSHFSFNRPEGACPACGGMGAEEIKMHYLPSMWVTCEACAGRRFSAEVLEALADFGGEKLSIADFYSLSIAEASWLIKNSTLLPEQSYREANRILNALCDTGLSYLTLGQPSPTLSGGEAQRVKLSKFLGQSSLAPYMLILDEPSTGLHPQDVKGLVTILRRLANSGATIVIVEHNTDIIRAANWCIDLGPGAGIDGGRVIYQGPPQGLLALPSSATGLALRLESDLVPRTAVPPDGSSSSPSIVIKNARANNLKGVNLSIPKNSLTAVTGLSGSGKSSLVKDVLESEARRRYFASLSMYERQAIKEGPEAQVDKVAGLGVTFSIMPARMKYNLRIDVGNATEISHHLSILFAALGVRYCCDCLGEMKQHGNEWKCPVCWRTAGKLRPEHFKPTVYASACPGCHGVGSYQVPAPEKLIIHPEKPLSAGAMYSPGFFPGGYLGKPFNHGYDMLQALARRYGFDPFQTPWREMTSEAQNAFLYGDQEPLQVHFQTKKRSYTGSAVFTGFYSLIMQWDTGGTFTHTAICSQCKGARLRTEYASVAVQGRTIGELHETTLEDLHTFLSGIDFKEHSNGLAAAGLRAIMRKLSFLAAVGLSYISLNRIAATLSAGEAQRIKLSGLLGSDLAYLTVLLDEPTRGLHPSEVSGLLRVLQDLRDQNNTVIVVEHDPLIIKNADHIIEMGPGAGAGGGQVVAQGSPREILQSDTATGRILGVKPGRPHRPGIKGTLTIKGARAYNLKDVTAEIPLGLFTGVCGVSGSGKSVLCIDTLGRALAPKLHTTSVAREPVEPGEHESITGAPGKTILVDQALPGFLNPFTYFGMDKIFAGIYAESGEACASGLKAIDFMHKCDLCGGKGYRSINMGFLPDVMDMCETCHGSGMPVIIRKVRLQGLSMEELLHKTIDEVYLLWQHESRLERILTTLRKVGLGYLTLKQPGYSLSGGESQRVKIAAELCRKTSENTLYILDEPTVGLHNEDVLTLVSMLREMTALGHTILTVEHHPLLLAHCDWLIELGPGGGPAGGRIIATGTPAHISRGDTPIARYVKEMLC